MFFCVHILHETALIKTVAYTTIKQQHEITCLGYFVLCHSHKIQLHKVISYHHIQRKSSCLHQKPVINLSVQYSGRTAIF